MPEQNAPGCGERPGTEDDSNSTTADLENLESLRDRLRSAERHRDDYRSLLQRTQADFENYQKHMQRDLAEERRYALAEFARELLPVLDNLQRALDAAQREGGARSLILGLTLVQTQLLDVFGRYGITSIGALGQSFDHNLHEAVLTRPSTDVAPGTVVEVLEPGYRLNDRVLRPAKVAVATALSPS